ncbi:MAG: RbsD/FucU family protein [Planctomycetota bacterium]
MLKHQLLHPEITAVLARAGHSSQVLIADGNYPASSTLGPHAQLISLNLAPGVVTVNQVLEVLITAIPIETINTMGMPADDPHRLEHDPEVWDLYRSTLQAAHLQIPLTPIDRWDFYKAVSSANHVLTIQTADHALWANLLLTVGVRESGS